MRGRGGEILEVPLNIIINKDTNSRLLALESDLYEHKKLLRNYESLANEFFPTHSYPMASRLKEFYKKRKIVQ